MTNEVTEEKASHRLNAAPSFTEHHVPRGQMRVYARDYQGAGPAFVLMHGFPDNLHIWDDLVPYLVESGRRVVTFDFLGFGASDKSTGAAYSFEQQLGDLEAVVESLGLGKIVPVAHDSSGFAAINYALTHPQGVDSVIMLNSAYAEDATVVWPELVTLFATQSLQALAMAIAQSPEQFEWLLKWQQQKFVAALPEAQKPHFSAFARTADQRQFPGPAQLWTSVCATGCTVLRHAYTKRPASAGTQGVGHSVQAHLGRVRSLYLGGRCRAAQVPATTRHADPGGGGPLVAD